MTDYAAYVYPLPDLYQQELTGSLDDGLERWSGYVLGDLTDDFMPLIATALRTPRVNTQWQKSELNAYIYPEWSSNLFGHILIVPSSLALGNILSNQVRTLEIANLFLEARDWLDLATDVEGLTFNNAPPGVVDSPGTPFSIPSFGSFLLEVGISSEGPATIDGTIFFVFDVEEIDVPVTGTRVIVFQFQPRPGIQETLEWKTDVMEAYDGTEQRAGLRIAPRQRFQMQLILDQGSDKKLRGLLFDWLARVFAVPVWWEVRRSIAPILPGDLVINVSTVDGDFRVGGLVTIFASNESFEVIEIESFDATTITLASEVVGSYDLGVKIMPARTTYSKTVPQAPRTPKHFTEYTVEFVTINNISLADATGQSTYDGKLLLDECNLIVSGDDDSFSRTVVVLDNDTGRVHQTSKVDRSRYHTKKVWDSPTLADLWRIRQLLHYIDGSRLSFFLPTFRDDLVVSDEIGPNATTFRIEDIGYTNFFQSRRPFADVRLTKTDGTQVIRRILDSELDTPNSEEVLTIDSAFDAINPIPVADIARVEFVMLVRIADDKAEIFHRYLGDAAIELRLVSVKE